MPEPRPTTGRAKRSGDRSALAALGVVRVDPDFETEYPQSNSSATECFASLMRIGEALGGELDRRIQHTVGVAQPIFTALAVIEGAGEPITPSEISGRVLVSGATMTATLDTLERRGWIRRTPNPDDRRSVLIEITPEGQSLADRVLPAIHAVEQRTFDVLTEGERRTLLELLSRVLARAAAIADEPADFDAAERVRPARLNSV